ncbi:hypothetical protein [Pseudotabrizicola alkalilacus]|uniref:Uncharacterized protein n=1 Tax=Pseudotabrizicola alkalilacus TaxID=2305252 RepID=A0A411YWP7_9RHOB|nr:hypothetical protein [Pseudotabrizicola alkalilacus]RGP35317.1 hypothetical protein D1012_20440 [Pseudotabrizicola alkalilacus]
MTHSVIAETTSLLRQLREGSFKCLAEESKHVSHNVYFCWDKANGSAAITLNSAEGRLLDADIVVTGTPGWFTLNFGLGFGQFQAGDTLGLVWSVQSSLQTNLYPFVRSVVGDDRLDTQLADPIRLTQSPGRTVQLHTIQPQDPLAWAKNFHTLVIPLPKQSFRLDLEDMRLFHAPRATGTVTQTPTLASLAI